MSPALSLVHGLIVLLSLASIQATTLPGQAADAHQLNSENWKEKTARGLWLVEHYSPGCGHCRLFAPTYSQLIKDHKHLEESRGMFFGQVNCQVQGDLCNAHDIKFYPQLKLYSNSHEILSYTGDRSLPSLSTLVTEQSLKYARGISEWNGDPVNHRKANAQQALKAGGGGVDDEGADEREEELSHDDDGDDGLGGGGGGIGPGFGGVNQEGVNVEVGEEGLKRFLAGDEGGAVFVKYYAPWCGHCKKLAPTWNELAKSLKNQVNVISVNCDENGRICSKMNVRGYPTLVLYNGGQKKPYNGARKLESMVDFARAQLSGPEIKHIENSELVNIRKDQEVFFLFMQTYGSRLTDWQTTRNVAKKELGPTPLYESSDPDIFSSNRLDPSKGSILAVFKENMTKSLATLHYGDSQPSEADIRKFIISHRYPLVFELTPDNRDELFQLSTRALLVLVALKKNPGDRQFVEELETYQEIAMAWAKGGRPFQQPVHFVWIDGVRHGKWLKQNYGINPKKLPGAVLIDPPLNEYYDTTLERTKLQFDGASIFSTLEGTYQHFIRGKPAGSVVERSSKRFEATVHYLMAAAANHPILAFVILGASVGFVIYSIQQLVSYDLGLNKPQGNTRLD